MTGDATAYLLALGANPWAIALAIIATTFIVEDVATIGAALLAAEGIISPTLALSSLFIGIFAGDLTLYGLGSVARTQTWAQNYIGQQRIEKGRTWLKGRYISALLTARFIPGLRLPTFSASGFLQMPFAPFVAVAACAGLVWTGCIFTLVYFFGLMIIETLGIWRWLIAAILIVLVFFGPTIAEHVRHRSHKTEPKGD